MSELATREVLRLQSEVFGDVRFEGLVTLSKGRLYDLRGSPTYRAKRIVWTRTRPTTVDMALHQAPEPDGLPGHVGVDTVHVWAFVDVGDRDRGHPVGGQPHAPGRPATRGGGRRLAKLSYGKPIRSRCR